jgi:restriction system protein
LEEVPPDHLRTLARKRRFLRSKDDYGNVIDLGWGKELSYYYDTVMLVRLLPKRDAAGLTDQASFEIAQVAQGWKELIVEYIDQKVALIEVERSQKAPIDPYDYEQWCADLLEAGGWRVRRTCGSGDQGADVIAEKDGCVVAIQCKLFGTPVGNKAVQEVTAARIYYGATHAVVVSNQGYTASAKKLAGVANVTLVHHEQLNNLPFLLEKIA